MTDQDKVTLVLTTCPTAEVAQSIAQALVTEKLAACVNQLPGVTSTYIWEGQVQSDQEILLLIKTTEARRVEVENRVLALHPYELPELIALPVCAGAEKYLDWVRHTVK